MKKFVIEITNKIIPVIMIGMMGLLILGKSLYTHTHKLADGMVVTHSHPYDKSNDSEPYKSHHHTETELLFFQNLEILFFISFSTLVFKSFNKKENLTIYFTSFYVSNRLFHTQERAPPFIIQS